MIFDHCLLKTIANSLDFGDFRQIILYFGLSTWTHIEYGVHFCFFGFIICIYIEQFSFKFVRCTLLINGFGSKSRTVDYFFHQLVLHKTYRPSTFSVMLQLKDLISETVKYPNKAKMVGNWSFFEKKSTVTYWFY